MHKLDLDRVAVMGSNYGGFLSLKLAASRSMFPMFKCIIARSPIVEWTNQGMKHLQSIRILYLFLKDVASSEKYFGSPDDSNNFAHYEVSIRNQRY